jgi:hypothetical protein
MTKVIILFTGLCAFVADRPVSPGDHSNHTVRVNLVETSASKNPHVATIIIDRTFVHPSSTRPGRKFVANENGEFWRFDLESGERITLEPISDICAERGCTEIVSNIEDENLQCPTATDYTDIYWVGQMKAMTKSRFNGSMRADCQWAPHLKTEFVRAQFVLSAGTLSVADFTRDPDSKDRIIEWQIAGDPPFEKAMADLVQLERILSGSELPYLQFWEHKDGMWLRKNKLVLDVGATGSAVVEVKNLPADSLCPQTDEEPPEQQPITNPHYRMFDYLLLYDKPDDIPRESSSSCDGSEIPLPQYNLCSRPSARFNDPQCPTSWFEPSP